MIATLLESRTAHRQVPVPSATRPLSLDEAYRVQDALRQALVERGERVVGWKAGLTSEKTQAMFQADGPVAGFLLASGVYPSGAAVPLARFAGLAVEVEVAFVMGRDLAGPGVTPASAVLAVEGALPALELVDFRYSGTTTMPDLIADGVAANAIVLGSALTPVRGLDLAVEGVVYSHNGKLAATNTAAEVLGNPLVSLAWLANHLGHRGLGLRAGDVVMSGSISALIRPAAGDTVAAAFTRLGRVEARFA
jgi:2-keto-4-pentenoate hydratase